MEKSLIKRSDGIEYYRKVKLNNFDCNLNIKYHKEKIDKLKEIAKSKGTNYNAMVRQVLDDFIKKEG